jgi:nucleotide-binding universal stress UspA family protein
MAQPGPNRTTRHSYCIVVGIDYSEVGETALRYAAELLPDRDDARLHVLHVAKSYGPLLRIDTADDVRTLSVPDAIEMLREYARARIAEGVLIDDARVVVDVRVGSPTHEIVALARELNADLIVVGTHGFGGVRRLILGSVADAVARHASCPVLIARPKTHNSGPPPAADEPEPNDDA